MTQTTVKKTDHALHRAILEELKWDPRVDETEVGIEVDNGVVTLTGTVDSYGKRVAAQDAVHRVAGVLDVANDVHVKLPGSPLRTDTDIAHAVRRALEWDVWIPEEKIQTTVVDGWVTLQGTVPYLSDRNQAERVLRNLTGVRGVTNNLLVKAPQADSHEVQHAIEEALERRAEREADRIQVHVQNGIVSVSGRVHNWAEKKAVLGAAGYAKGVQQVEDHLRIDPSF